MPRIVFVAPFLADTTLRFAAAVADEPGVTCSLVSQQPLQDVPPVLRRRLAGHRRVRDPFDAGELAAAARSLGREMGGLDRMLGIFEQLQVPLAEARELLGLPGMRPETARNFRDKSRMKTVLAEAGIPCARHQLVTSADQATAFVTRVGFPVVFKPPAGAGARSTFRVDDEDAFRRGLEYSAPREGEPVLLEEFITGREYSFDCAFVRGAARWSSFSRYLPTPLEVLENPWIQWCVILPRRIDDPLFRKVQEVGVRALEVLGLETGLAHMEWFERPDGSVAISEVGARPPGAQITSMLSYAHSFDIYRGWAHLMAYDELTPPQRRYAVATVFLRGQGRGQVRAVHGLAEAQRELGPLIVEAKLPRKGQSPGSGYEGEGYVILRAPETPVVTAAAKRVMELIRVEIA